jgi:hypothetical protein
MKVKQVQQNLLEFLARLIMNALKIAIGFGFGYAYAHPDRTIVLSFQIWLVISLFATVISIIETWQDWEIVPDKRTIR